MADDGRPSGGDVVREIEALVRQIVSGYKAETPAYRQRLTETLEAWVRPGGEREEGQ